MPSSRPGRALMRSILAAARGGLGCGQGGKVQHRRFEAGSALARCCVCLGVSSKGAVHRCRARPRCRSVHAAPVCGVGGKGTATHIGADEGGAAGEESERCKPRQPDKSLYCRLNGTHCPCASSGCICHKPNARNPGDAKRRGAYPQRDCQRSQRSRCPTSPGRQMAPVIC